LADSNITKKALAQALKDLMQETRFDKITVGNICDRCEMNRKSFYYHFKSKYDLVDWIYHTEFICFAKDKEYNDELELLTDMCSYFENNKRFYRRVLKYDNQNSFFNSLTSLLMPVMEKAVDDMFADSENKTFFLTFFADSLILAIKKWLMDTNDMSAEKFVKLLHNTILTATENIVVKKHK